MQALLGFSSEARSLRHARAHLRHLFPYLPQQSGYNKRLRRAADLVHHIIRALAVDTSLWDDEVWVVDSVPVECGRSRETREAVRPGWMGRVRLLRVALWGLRLHLICTLGGLPILFALTGAKADERETLRDMLDTAPEVASRRAGQTITGDKNYLGRGFERDLTDRELVLLRPTRMGSPRGPDPTCSSHCGRPSSRSTRP
jgi:hypothetical protein